jgi:hypothetical protein
VAITQDVQYSCECRALINSAKIGRKTKLAFLMGPFTGINPLPDQRYRAVPNTNIFGRRSVVTDCGYLIS